MSIKEYTLKHLNYLSEGKLPKKKAWQLDEELDNGNNNSYLAYESIYKKKREMPAPS